MPMGEIAQFMMLFGRFTSENKRNRLILRQSGARPHPTSSQLSLFSQFEVLTGGEFYVFLAPVHLRSASGTVATGGSCRRGVPVTRAKSIKSWCIFGHSVVGVTPTSNKMLDSLDCYGFWVVA